MPIDVEVAVEGEDTFLAQGSAGGAQPNFVDQEQFYARDGNRTVMLKGVELAAWLRRWAG